MLDDIDPKYWGKYFWKTMHFITLAYPNNPEETDKKNVKNAILSISEVLPCIICRIHFKKLLLQYPLNDYVLQNKKNFVLWLYTLHNFVNKQNNKDQLSLDDFQREYMDENPYAKYIMVLIIVCICFIIFKWR